MFERPHHRRIAQVLGALDAAKLREYHCWFGGGTAIALRHGEYRESVDIDFLVSDIQGFRAVRQLLTGTTGIAALLRADSPPIAQAAAMRADPYGVRTFVHVGGQEIKFEVVLEARIELALPGPLDVLCGVATLTPLDMATSKLLANVDRWNDDGVFNRDLIDLAMMNPALPLLRQAVRKAEGAYGPAVLGSLAKAMHRLQTRPDWLDRCLRAMAMPQPRAVLWQRVRRLGRVLPSPG